MIFPMRVAYVEPISGASGDMILGALLDAGLTAFEAEYRRNVERRLGPSTAGKRA